MGLRAAWFFVCPGEREKREKRENEGLVRSFGAVGMSWDAYISTLIADGTVNDAVIYGLKTRCVWASKPGGDFKSISVRATEVAFAGLAHDASLSVAVSAVKDLGDCSHCVRCETCGG